MAERAMVAEPWRSFVVGDAVCVRLLGAPPATIEQVRRELGGVEGPGPGLPVLEIRFVARAAARDGLTTLGMTGGAFAFDDAAFYVAAASRLMRLSLDGEPGCIELLVEHGFGPIPHLAPLVGLLALERGLVLLHASSFRIDGLGVLAAGWQSGGKTEVLLGAMTRSDARVEYAGDEWTIVGWPDGTMSGLPSYPQLWAWQVDQLPALARRLSRGDRLRLASITAARGVLTGLPPVSRRGVIGRLLLDVSAWLANAARVSVPPERLFGRRVVRGRGPVDLVLLASAGSDAATAVVSRSGQEVAARMAASLAYERRGLDGLHAQYRYAFPGRRWARLDLASERELAALERALRGRRAVELRHPYPPDLRLLGLEVVRVAAAAGAASTASGAGSPGSPTQTR